MNRRRFIALAGLGAVALARGKMPSLPAAAAPEVLPVPLSTGSFLFVDGGTLDLGLIRDQAYDVTNHYRVFAETFENTTFEGRESLWIGSTAAA